MTIMITPSGGHDHDHGHDSTDGHSWLDPVNAKVLVDRIAQVLSAKEPANAALFTANAAALKTKLDELSAELARDLAPVAGKPYIVFHDALQYFERRYKLRVVGSISMSPDVPPSAKRLSTLRKKIASLGAVCVFAEPQFDTRLVNNLDRGHPRAHRHHRPGGQQDRTGSRSLFHPAAQPHAGPEKLPRAPARLDAVIERAHAYRTARLCAPGELACPRMMRRDVKPSCRHCAGIQYHIDAHALAVDRRP